MAWPAWIEPEVREHINRWRAPGTFAEWKANIQYLRNYATNRPTAFARQQLVQKFGITGDGKFDVEYHRYKPWLYSVEHNRP